jgi:SAM-dependent methyltransferase
MHHRFGYIRADLWYEALVDALVTQETRWIDVGGGKSVFPHNDPLSTILARRCALLVGVDPSENIHDNPFVHERVQGFIEQYSSGNEFDLATLRMVAEHITDPTAAVAALARLIRPTGKVVIYTPNKWSIASLAARVVPNAWHQRVTGFLWNTKDEDVFPTAYLMNTRKQLARAFTMGGFREVDFVHVDSCCLGQRFRTTCFAELLTWRLLRTFNLTFPENNLLAVYERLGTETEPLSK